MPNGRRGQAGRPRCGGAAELAGRWQALHLYRHAAVALARADRVWQLRRQDRRLVARHHRDRARIAAWAEWHGRACLVGCSLPPRPPGTQERPQGGAAAVQTAVPVRTRCHRLPVPRSPISCAFDLPRGKGKHVYIQVELYPPLFEVDSFSSAIFRIPKAPPPSLKRPEAFSDGLAAFLARCLQKDPTRRATAAQLLADAFMAPAATAPLGRPTLLACLKQLARAREADAARAAAEGQPPALMGMHGLPVGGTELARHGYVDFGISGAADGGASAPPGLPVVYGVPTLMPLGGAGPACYLLFTEDRGGALLLQWSETPVDGALAAFVPAKPPPRFKLTANGGQSELKRGVGVSESTNLKAFYAAWASFIRAAFASGGRFFFMSNLPTNPVGVYLCQADSSVRKVQFGSCTCTCNAPRAAASMRCTCAWHVHGMRTACTRHAAHGVHHRYSSARARRSSVFRLLLCSLPSPRALRTCTGCCRASLSKPVRRTAAPCRSMAAATARELRASLPQHFPRPRPRPNLYTSVMPTLDPSRPRQRPRPCPRPYQRRRPPRCLSVWWTSAGRPQWISACPRGRYPRAGLARSSGARASAPSHPRRRSRYRCHRPLGCRPRQRPLGHHPRGPRNRPGQCPWAPRTFGVVVAVVLM